MVGDIITSSLDTHGLDPVPDRRATRCAARCVVSVLLVVGYALTSQAQPVGTARRSPGLPVDTTGLPPAAFERMEVLNVKDADLRDVFRGMAHQYGLNLVVDNAIDRQVTVRLAQVPVIEAVAFLCREHGLSLTRSGPILKIGRPPEPGPPPVMPPDVRVHDGRLSVDLREAKLADVVHHLARKSGLNILVRKGVTGVVTGMLREVPVEVGLRTLMQNNGFSIRKQDGIFHVDRADMPAGEGEAGTFWVQVQDSLVSLEAVHVSIAHVLREIGARTEANLVTYRAPEGHITARVEALTLEEALNVLLRGTDVTYRRERDVYFVGSKQARGIATTRLVRLDHIRADAVPELIPEAILEQATVQVVREHNGLMVTGTNDVILELESFVGEIDYPTPQILIEALVVDFSTTDLFELGVRFGWYPDDRDGDDASGAGGYGFATGEGADRGFRHRGDGTTANGYIESLNALTSLVGVRNIGRLPDDFYFQIHALAQEGRANVRSRPQIATLNGHAAHISIGTTQYYILRTNTPYQSPGQVYLQETERFEKIEANVRLEVVPWVSASGEVTTEIRPEFSTPVGELDPEVPPTINSRVLDSTVRLRDGETIILGGLIQDVESVVYDKVPVLGSLPIVGGLFRGRSRETTTSELVIFLTPHVFYGDERDDDKWQTLRDELDLSSEATRDVGYTKLKR